jgi:hypothetical protein
MDDLLLYIAHPADISFMEKYFIPDGEYMYLFEKIDK